MIWKTEGIFEMYFTEYFYERQSLQRSQCDSRCKTTVVDYQEIWVRGLEVLLSEIYFGSSKDHNFIVVFPQNFSNA